MHPIINIATRAAREASRILMHSFETRDSLEVTDKGFNDFVSEVDQIAEQVIIRELRRAYPHHGILGEEGGQDGEGDEYQWVIDPLDGTTNYLHGFPQFSISIALRVRGRVEHGLVYDPLRDELFTASRGAGALLNNRRLRVTARQGLKGALLGTGFPFRDHTHLDTYLKMFKSLLRDTAGIRRPGSAALDLAYVACGRLDGFWELGLAEWDFAAGILLIQEAGGLVTDLAGGDRYFETGNLVVGGPRVHQAMLKLIQPCLDEHLGA
ncbi:MAG: inositol monophosphatase family protein [Pseudomonadota bacterium]